jgi:hypothetical protein
MPDQGVNIVAYVRSNESRTNERVKHFGNALGARFESRERPVECDIAIQAGFQISPAMTDAMERGVPIIILENPVWHYGDKSATYTWGYNGLNGLSTGGYMGNRPIRPHPELEPMRDSGDRIIFGQFEHDKSLRGQDIYQWVDDMLEVYPGAEFREHPMMLDQNDPPQESFDDALDRCGLAITYSSTVGAEALIRGIPSVACHAGSWAYGVEDRRDWIRELSWRHWSTNETIDTDYIMSGYGRARAMADIGEYDNMSNGRAQ